MYPFRSTIYKFYFVELQRCWRSSIWLEELQCVCLSPLAVQNILQPVQQAQTGR